MAPEILPVRCSRCQQTFIPSPKPEPGFWLRLLPGQSDRRPPEDRTCPHCAGYGVRPDDGYAEAIPTDSGHPLLKGVTCGRCHARMNYKPAHKGRTVPCANCASLLVLP